MILRELDIDGFGVFAEQHVGRFAPGLNVISGANEAGKSTLLAFVRALLFGFPDGRSRDNGYLPARGGVHGGSLSLETEAGDLYRLERRPGPRGGGVTLTVTGASHDLGLGRNRGGPGRPALQNGDGAVAGDRLRELLGATSRELFRNVYAFSLSELQSFETLQGDGVRAALYGASTGASVLALPRVQADLERQIGDLYKPNGTQPLLNLELAEYSRIESELADAGRFVERFTAVSSRLAEIAAELETSAQETRTARRLRDQCEALLRAWPSWIEWLAAVAQLAELPLAPDRFPIDAVRRLDVLVAQHEERDLAHRLAMAGVADREEDSRLGAGDDSVERLLAPLGPSWTTERVLGFDRSLFARQTLRDLQGEIAAAREASRAAESALAALPTELPDLDLQLRRERAELDRILAELGRDWTVERLRRVDLSAPRRARLAETENRLAAANIARVESAARLDVAREGAAAERQTCDVAEELAGSGPPRLARAWSLGGGVLLALAALLEAAFAGIANGLLPEATEVPFDWNAAPLVAVALASAGVVLLIVAGGLSRRRARTTATLAQQIADARRRRDQAMAAVENAAAHLDAADADYGAAEAAWHDDVASMGLPDVESAAALHAVAMPAVEAARRHLARAAEIEADRERALTALAQQRSAAASHAQAAAGREAEVGERWRAWLADGGLPVHLSPETALEAFDLIHRAIDAAEARSQRRKEVEAQLSSARRAADDAAALAAQSAAAIAELIAVGGARDAEDLRRRAGIEEKRAALMQLAAERQRTMVEVSDCRDVEALVARLRSLSRADLEEEVRRLDGELEEDERHAGALRDERAALELEKRGLASSDDIARKRAEQERLKTEIRELAHRWSRASVARHLIEEAKRRFERERQPQVLRDASLSLERMTAGRYLKVRATLDPERPLEVVHADGSARPPEHLSRGTQEQLYLALRFGYVVNHDAGGEPLPIVMDEVLVNFDPERAAHAAAAIADLAQRRQVLYFTCHPWVRELFAACSPDTNQLRLENGRIA